MSTNEIQSIDGVIDRLEAIIQDSIEKESPLGYFAALYQKVTVKVKEGIDEGFFDENLRMEKLDIIFASRYLNAYDEWQQQAKPTESWVVAFKLAKDYWPVVLQHLLIGMNAHINLDLGIAAAQVMKGKDIEGLEGDFNKINQILSDLVNEVENELALIWPRLQAILRWTRKVDNFLVDFSMKLARNGAWKFAKEIHALSVSEQPACLAERDQKVAKIARLISHPGPIASFIFSFIRFGEKGDVAQKIQRLREPAGTRTNRRT